KTTEERAKELYPESDNPILDELRERQRAAYIAGASGATATQPTDAVEEGEEITEHEMSWLLRLREYFSENDKTQFEHSAYHFLDNLIKKLNQSQYKLIKK